MNLHLSHEQLCDLLLSEPQPSDTPDVVQDHLRACLICSAELRSLRDSLSCFRDASVSYANQQLAQSSARRSSIIPPHSYLSQPLYWAAAVVIFVAALFPLTMHRQPEPTTAQANVSVASPHAGESNEALLEDIDQKLSADVPSPLEPLADPTSGGAVNQAISYQRKN